MEYSVYSFGVDYIKFTLDSCQNLGNDLEIYPKECESGYYKVICTPMFIATLFIIGMTWKQSRCPITDEWIKKMWYLYT
jgi:hypothetical protein